MYNVVHLQRISAGVVHPRAYDQIGRIDNDWNATFLSEKKLRAITKRWVRHRFLNTKKVKNYFN